jgi:hypothetical protein
MRIALAVIISAIFCLVSVAGQPSLTDQQQEAVRQALGLPPGSTVTLEHTTTSDGGTLKIVEEATGEGASLRAQGDKIVSDFNSTAPGASLGNGREATGSTVDSKSTVSAAGSLLKSPLFWIGIFCLAISLASLFVRPPMVPVPIPFRASIIVGAAGVGCIAAAMFPVATFFIVAASVALIAVPYVYCEYTNSRNELYAKKGEKSHVALRAVAAGISDFKKLAKDPTIHQVSPETWERLKVALQDHLSDEGEQVVAEVRIADRLE